jgi:membrane-bound lytic murein transglycosylase D
MVVNPIRLIFFCSLSFFLLLAGCSSTMFQSGQLYEQERDIHADSTAEIQDPDLMEVEPESEVCLDNELEALRLAGDWNTPQSEIIQQTPAGDLTIPDVTFDFPITINPQVNVYLELFQGRQRTYFSRWLARSGYYLPMIQKELENSGLPLDLAYLAMIESGFSQLAYSRSHAVGLWQFMKATGRQYDLLVDNYVDERRDAVKSTKAAVSYLKDLYAEFGDWYLAVAAYNGGPGTMRKAVRRAGTKDFWEIAQKKSLRLETKRYVPKLIAAIMIAKEPEKYGFTDIVYEKPLVYDELPVGPGLSFEAAALLTGVESAEIKNLNLALKNGKTPLNQQKFTLKIPYGTRALAESNMPRLHSVASTDYKTHIVRKNETLTQVCRRYNINTTTLLKINNLKSAKLVAGSRLRIPYRTIHYRILPEGMDASIAARDELILHTIKKGETISKISKQYQVPSELIVSWNGLSSVHKITAGQQLALYLRDSGPSVATKKNAPEQISRTDNVVILSSTYKSAPPSTTLQAQYRWYQVKNGDSLWTISRRFNTSPDDIKKWNNLKTNLIHPGNRLKLKNV